MFYFYSFFKEKITRTNIERDFLTQNVQWVNLYLLIRFIN
jgi:hypothetical protein